MWLTASAVTAAPVPPSRPGDRWAQGQGAKDEPQRHRQRRQTEGEVVGRAADTGCSPWPFTYGMPGVCIQVAMPTRICITTPVPTASFTAPAGTPLPGTASRRAIPISTTPTTSWTAVQPQLNHIGIWSMSGRKVSLKSIMTTVRPAAADGDSHQHPHPHRWQGADRLEILADRASQALPAWSCSSRRVSLLFCQPLAEALQRAMRPDFGRARRNTENLTDLLETQTQQVVQHQHLLCFSG